MMPFQKNHVIFAQGEPSDGLFFIQEGKVQLSVVSEAGKEATLGILVPISTGLCRIWQNFQGAAADNAGMM